MSCIQPDDPVDDPDFTLGNRFLNATGLYPVPETRIHEALMIGFSPLTMDLQNKLLVSKNARPYLEV